MKTVEGPIIDMTTAGDFAWQPNPGPSLGTIIARLAAFTVLLGLGALIFWLAVFTVPVLIIGALVAYAAIRYRMARHGLRFRAFMARSVRR